MAAGCLRTAALRYRQWWVCQLLRHFIYCSHTPFNRPPTTNSLGSDGGAICSLECDLFGRQHLCTRFSRFGV